MTLKNWVALSVFLFGTTFLWMTRDFLASPRQGTGTLWSMIQLLVLISIVAFSAAAWGIFKEAAWWEPVALVAAIVGLAAFVPYVVGVWQVGDVTDAGVQINIAMHAVGLAVVLAGVLVPVVHEWVARQI